MSIDITSLIQAAKSLDGLGAAATRAEKATNNLILTAKGLDNLAAAAMRAEKATDRLALAGKGLDNLAAATRRAEAATDRLAAAQGQLASEARRVLTAVDGLDSRLTGLRGAIDPLSTAQRKLGDEMRESAGLYRAATKGATDYAKAVAGLDARLDKVSGAQAGLAAQHAAGAKGAKLQVGELAKLAFSLGEVGLGAMQGSGALTALLQAGPLLIDMFSMVEAGAAAAGGIGPALAPVMGALLPIVAVVGLATAAFALFEREVDKHTKGATTWSDTWQATVNVVGKAIMEGPIGDGLRWLGETFGKVLDAIVNGAMSYLDRFVSVWGATFETIIKHWRQFPQVMGAIIVGFANGAIQNIEGLINASIGGINRLTSLVGWKQIGKVDLPEIQQANNAVAADFERTRARIDASFRASREGLFKEIVVETDRVSSAKKGAGASKPGQAATASRPAAVDEEAEALKRKTETAEAYLASLRDENAEYGKAVVALSAIEMKEKEIAAARAAAPTLELKLAIGEQGDYAIGMMKAAEAIKEINGPLIKIPSPDFKGSELSNLIDELTVAHGLAGEMAASMERAFGRMGKAIGGVATVMTDYRVKMAELDKAEHDRSKSSEEIARERASLQISSYGDMASAAKGFFDEGSKGYKALEVAEKTFRAFEAAIAVANFTRKMFFIGAETTAAVGGEAAKASASLTASGLIIGANTAVGTSAAAAAVATQGMGDPITAWPRIAAMAALMAGLGFMAFGGGGGAVPGATDAEDRQKAQGSGSVLGDAAAKSESIAKALEIVAANTNIDLEYSNEMLKALRSIDGQIGTVAAALARSLGAGGALSTDKLNLGTTGRPATLGNLGFGRTINRSLQDQGLSFGAQSLSEILAGGIQGETFQQVLETKVKKAFGITYSNKSSSITTTGALDAGFADQITQLIGSLKTGVLEAAKILGVTGAEATLDAFKVNLGKLSFKDMSGAEIQEALNGIFGKLGDDLAATAIPSLKELAKVGEGAFETLARVARGYQVVDVSLRAIGMEFGAVGVASLAARERLVDLVGGLDAFTEQTAYFAENFLTDVERMAPVQRAVAEEMRRLGLAGITTKDQFKSLVLGLDLSSQAGAELYAALMAVAPAFIKVVDFASEGSQAVQDAREALSAAYERERDAIQGVVDRFKSLADGLQKFGAELANNPIAGLSPTEQYERTRREFLAVAASAATGSPEAMGELQSISQAFLEASKETSATLVDYQRDIATVRNAVAAAEVSARAQVSVAEQQLSALNASVDGLITINDSVLSVRDAIAALRAAEAAAVVTVPPAPTAPNPGATAPPPSPAAPTPKAPDWDSYTTHYGDVAAEYARNASSRKGVAYLASLGISNLQQFGEWHWRQFGQSEGRTPYAMGGVFTNGIVSQPTDFHNSEMGESGPEAIMPLVRGPRGLAVRALGANDNGETAQELRELRAEVAKLNAALVAIAKNSNAAARQLDRWDGNGLPAVRVV